jgi:L-cystine uptake protein TcyP (sodium:dicarboxylate symporter family)
VTGLGWLDIILIVFAVIVAIGVGVYFLNRWANKRYTQQQDMVEKNKQSASIYVIDMKRDKAANVNLPKVVMENLPRTAKAVKMNFVKAKVGPQIVTLMCDKNIFAALDVKKTYQVELAGIYIVSVKGAKTKFEMKEAAKAKRKKAKAAQKSA